MTRVPLLAGTRVIVVTPPEGSAVLRPTPPGEAVLDVGAAVRDALRFPLAGQPLEALVTPGGRATIVVEPHALPIPGAQHDPRQDALAATIDELARIGVGVERQTVLVAGGLARRSGQRELEALVSPTLARRFRGTVEVHDAERDDLVELGSVDGTPLRVHPALVETDLVLVVSAAQSVLHGGPAALLAAGGPEALRAAGAASLLETAGSAGWDLAVRLERALAARVPVLGASLALDHPRFGGAAHGYPYEQGALERVAGSPLRVLYGALPAALRARILQSLPSELAATAAFAGPPSVAHAEALLRSIDARSTVLEGRLDALCIGIPHVTPFLPRERPNPLVAAYLGLGLGLRFWRDAFPLVEGGTAILVHRFHRRFAHPTQQPYRAFFAVLRGGREPERLADVERSAAVDRRAVAAYRGGRACHPLLPFADWAACESVTRRLGAVLIAGCRDAVAARQLGFVPTHGIGAAFEMARGLAEGDARFGVLVAPPYFPVQVSG